MHLCWPFRVDIVLQGRPSKVLGHYYQRMIEQRGANDRREEIREKKGCSISLRSKLAAAAGRAVSGALGL